MRIVIFTDVNIPTTANLVRATVHLADGRSAHRVVGLVTNEPDEFRYGFSRGINAFVRRAAVAATNSEVPAGHLWESGLDLNRFARRHGIPVLTPPTGDPNDSGFVRDLSRRLRPDLAVSFFCRHRFARRLRAAFAQCVNYHDGLLPQYRGVMATSFSIFAGESCSGLSFHHMTGRLDAGPVLLQDSVPIDERSDLRGVSRAKMGRALAILPRVFERIAKDDPGAPQSGEGSYFSAHDWMAMIHLSDPANATRREILRRIRAFGIAYLTIGGTSFPVTRLRSARPGDRLAFRTLDGHLLRPDRFDELPALIYRPRRRANRQGRVSNARR